MQEMLGMLTVRSVVANQVTSVRGVGGDLPVDGALTGIVTAYDGSPGCRVTYSAGRLS